MTGDILDQGLNLMAFGMGTVFVFLTLLVIAISIMSFIIGKFFPVSITESKTSLLPTKSGEEQQVVSAITAAIKLHLSRRNK